MVGKCYTIRPARQFEQKNKQERGWVELRSHKGNRLFTQTGRPVSQFEEARSQDSEVRIRILRQIKNHSGQIALSANCCKLLFSRMLSQ